MRWPSLLRRDNSPKYRVLFVCMGNICRSPAAEGIFRHMVEQAELSNRIEIASAGTQDYHVGERPDARMRETASRRGYNLNSRGRWLADDDFDKFDLLLAADSDNYAKMISRARTDEHRAKVQMMLNWHPHMPGEDVPDPYYGGQQGFEDVLDLLEVGLGPLLLHVAAQLEVKEKQSGSA